VQRLREQGGDANGEQEQPNANDVEMMGLVEMREENQDFAEKNDEIVFDASEGPMAPIDAERVANAVRVTRPWLSETCLRCVAVLILVLLLAVCCHLDSCFVAVCWHLDSFVWAICFLLLASFVWAICFCCVGVLILVLLGHLLFCCWDLDSFV
jgi:hypothetical protein